MTSTLITRISAAVFLIGGVAFLFAPDVLLPRLIAGFPPEASWLGQLLAAALLAMAALNWLSRSAVLGGVYGRPVVLANLAFYFISAIVLLKALQAGSATALLLLAAPAVLLALVYGMLLFRGPLEKDVQAHSAA